MRDYGNDKQIGLEKTPAAYVSELVEVFRGVRRALHPSGVLWLNLGDSYTSGNETGRKDNGRLERDQHKWGQPMRDQKPRSDRRTSISYGLPSKNLIGIPWRVAFALQEDGWYLRQWLPWVKRNPMPESAEDRPSTACETVFLLSKSADYYFDMEAGKRPAAEMNSQRKTGRYNTADRYGAGNGGNSGLDDLALRMRSGEHDTRNFRSADLWFDSVGLLIADGQLLGLDVSSQPYKSAHFAVMPEKLVAPLIRTGSSERGVCPACGAPRVRVIEKDRRPTRPGEDTKVFGGVNGRMRVSRDPNHAVVGNRDPERHVTSTRTVGWEPGCDCGKDPIPALVIDPFAGAGTVPAVAFTLGRRAAGCDLNPEYVEMSRKRVGNRIPPLF